MSNAQRPIRYPRYVFRKTLALELLEKYLPPPARFLEIGCGTGDFGITLGHRGYTGLMTDFSSSVQQMVQQRLSEERINVTFQLADAFQLKMDPPADFAVMFEVLEHVKDDEALLAHIRQMIQPAGYLLMSVPAHQRQWGYSDEASGHYRRYERDNLRRILQNNNFHIVELWSYGFPWLNIAKIFRDWLFRQRAKQMSDKSLEVRSEHSGLPHFRIPGVGLTSQLSLWKVFIWLSQPFNRFDWSEGYLCLAQREY